MVEDLSAHVNDKLMASVNSKLSKLDDKCEKMDDKLYKLFDSEE